MAVTKVTSDHGVNTTFGMLGKLTYGYGSNSDFGSDLAIEPGGKIDVAGAGSVANDFALTRLTANGVLDHSLNGGTTTSADFGGDDGAHAIALQANGKIVLGGGRSCQQFAIARFQPGGPLDSTFGQGGKVTVSLPGGNGVALGMALAPDGQILAGNSGPSAAVVRLQGDSAAAGGAPVATGPSWTGGGTTGSGPGGSSTSRLPRCGAKPATIVGTSGNDTLKGTKRADVIVGLAGNDRVSGLGANDILCGGTGQDKLSGGSGNDRLFRDNGQDVISGGAGSDSLTGGAGRDSLTGGKGKDRLNGGAGKDKLNGGPGKDRCAGKDTKRSC